MATSSKKTASTHKNISRRLPRNSEFRREQYPLRATLRSTQPAPTSVLCSCPNCGSVETAAETVQASPGMHRPEYFTVRFRCQTCRNVWTEKYTATAIAG